MMKQACYQRTCCRLFSRESTCGDVQFRLTVTNVRIQAQAARLEEERADLDCQLATAEAQIQGLADEEARAYAAVERALRQVFLPLPNIMTAADV